MKRKKRTFGQKWTKFKKSKEIKEIETRCQLYQCCEEGLDNAILKGNADVVNLRETELLMMIKKLAVVSFSVVVRRSDFLSTRQDLTQNSRLCAARLKKNM